MSNPGTVPFGTTNLKVVTVWDDGLSTAEAKETDRAVNDITKAGKILEVVEEDILIESKIEES